jgi:hypothetical protein
LKYLTLGDQEPDVDVWKTENRQDNFITFHLSSLEHRIKIISLGITIIKVKNRGTYMLNQMYYRTLPQVHDASSHIHSLLTIVNTRDLAAS